MSYAKKNNLLTRLDHIQVIVHPFFRNEKGKFVDNKEAAQSRLLYEYICNVSRVDSPTQITAIMPSGMTTTMLANATITIPESNMHYNLSTWGDLYRQLQKDSIYPEQALLVPDIQPIGSKPEAFVTTIKKAGFALDTNTTVALMGEWLDACVLKVARQLFTLPQINTIQLDRQGVLGSSQTLTGKTNMQRDLAFFLSKFTSYTVTSSKQYITIQQQ